MSGIGLAWIEQIASGDELRMLLFDLRELDLALLQRPVITAPGEDAVRARDRMTGEGADDDHREGRHRRVRIRPKMRFAPPMTSSKNHE